MRRLQWRRLARLGCLAALAALAVAASEATASSNQSNPLSKIGHIVVIYEENHSFDNLYGGWEGVNGLANADAAHTTQVDQGGVAFTCLKQNDVNLSSLPATCNDAGHGFSSAFVNAPFGIDAFLAPTDTTCPGPTTAFNPNGYVKGAAGNLAGGCTRDLMHRFYSEQYQLDGGLQDRYVTGSDAEGLVMGYYDTTALPVYKFLHSPAHPAYSVEDNFFQAAFGGSFLNHQWLIAARTPVYSGAVPAGLRTILDANGMPVATPFYTPLSPVADKAVTAVCPAPLGLACGNYAVNTIQPVYAPHSGGATLPALSTTTIGDELSAAGVDWAWYSGGWSNANGYTNQPGWTNGGGPNCSDPNVLSGSAYPVCPDRLFQFHHQPFNYYSNYAPGTAARTAHLRDEAEFLQLAQSSTNTTCNLKPVSFVKPIGEENEHPGYASESTGSDHLVQLLQAIENKSSACWKNTLVIVTYDEFGGQWDHVPPPGQGATTPGPHDIWGPGTRIPALVLSPFLQDSFVLDHTEHDTTSILATIEHRFGVAALGTRDASVADLSTVFAAQSPQE